MCISGVQQKQIQNILQKTFLFLLLSKFTQNKFSQLEKQSPNPQINEEIINLDNESNMKNKQVLEAVALNFQILE